MRQNGIPGQFLYGTLLFAGECLFVSKRFRGARAQKNAPGLERFFVAV